MSPLERGGPSFEQTGISFTENCFVPNIVEIGPVVLEEKMKMWKVYGQMDGDGQQAIRKAHLRTKPPYYICFEFPLWSAIWLSWY